MMPHDENIEKLILGSLMDYPELWFGIAENFHEGLFHKENNKIVAKAISALKNENKAADVVSVFQWVKSQGLSDACDRGYIFGLINQKVYSALEEKVLILAEYHMRRELLTHSYKTIGAVEQTSCDVLEVIADHEKFLTEITNKTTTSKVFDALDCHNEMIDHLNKLEKVKHGELIGVDTGFQKLNELTAGWQKSDLVVLAGRPGMGKTSLSLNITRSALVKTPVLYFSYEMSKMQIYARMCSQVTSIPLEKYLRTSMTKEERQIFNSSTYHLSQSKLYIDDRAGNVNHIKRKSRKLKRDKNIGLIVIDHLGFVQKPKSTKSTNDLVGEITADLKGLAKELELPIILLCQLNRGDKNQVSEPVLKDLRDSGNIEQDADIVGFIHRPEYYGILDDGHGNSTIGKAEIIIRKHRNGGLENILVGFDGKCTNFYDLRSSSNAQENSLQPNYEF